MENKIIDNLLNKFVTEEIMTKSEFESRIDKIMEKHEGRMNTRFEVIDAKFEKRFESVEHIIANAVKWNIGIAIGTLIGLGGLLLTLIPLIRK